MINCPLGLIGGTTGTASVFGCDNIIWSSSSGDLDVTPQANGVAILTAAVTASGVATITAECIVDGNSTKFTCPVNLIPPDQILVCETTTPLAVAFDTCGEKCDCGTISLNFDCEEVTLCDVVTVTVEVKDCSAPVQEPCIPLTPIQLRANIHA